MRRGGGESSGREDNQGRSGPHALRKSTTSPMARTLTMRNPTPPRLQTPPEERKEIVSGAPREEKPELEENKEDGEETLREEVLESFKMAYKFL